MSQPDKYHWDVTQNPRRWVDVNEKKRRDLQRARELKKKPGHEKYTGKNEKARAALKAAAKLAKAPVHKAPMHKAPVKVVKKVVETTIVKKKTVQTRMGHGLPVVPVHKKKTVQTRMGHGLPVVPVHKKVVPVHAPRVPIIPHGFQHHKDPSDVQFAETHSDFVAVPRLSWNGRPITSHESVQQPSHEEPVPQTHIKVI